MDTRPRKALGGKEGGNSGNDKAGYMFTVGMRTCRGCRSIRVHRADWLGDTHRWRASPVERTWWDPTRRSSVASMRVPFLRPTLRWARLRNEVRFE